MFITSQKSFSFKIGDEMVLIKMGSANYEQPLVEKLFEDPSFRLFIDAGVIIPECDILTELEKAHNRCKERCEKDETVQILNYSGFVRKLQKERYDKLKNENGVEAKNQGQRGQQPEKKVEEPKG